MVNYFSQIQFTVICYFKILTDSLCDYATMTLTLADLSSQSPTLTIIVLASSGNGRKKVSSSSKSSTSTSSSSSTSEAPAAEPAVSAFGGAGLVSDAGDCFLPLDDAATQSDDRALSHLLHPFVFLIPSTLPQRRFGHACACLAPFYQRDVRCL
jgi:hypothetical protein